MPLIRSPSPTATLPDLRNAFPELLGKLAPFGEALMRGPSPFSVAQRELIAAYVSAVNSCRWCYGVHSRVAAGFGVDAKLLASLLEDPGKAPIESRLQPVLLYARKLTETPSTARTTIRCSASLAILPPTDRAIWLFSERPRWV